MNGSIQTVLAEIKSLNGVTDADTYTSDHATCSVDIIEVVGGEHEDIMETIVSHVGDDECVLRMGLKLSYAVYTPLGWVDEFDNSKFDIIGYDDEQFEAILCEEGPDEPAETGEVFTFDRHETEGYDVGLFDESDE